LTAKGGIAKHKSTAIGAGEQSIKGSIATLTQQSPLGIAVEAVGASQGYGGRGHGIHGKAQGIKG